VDGDCEPQRDALELGWFTSAEAPSPGLLSEMTGGQDVLMQPGLSHVGY